MNFQYTMYEYGKNIVFERKLLLRVKNLRIRPLFLLVRILLFFVYQSYTLCLIGAIIKLQNSSSEVIIKRKADFLFYEFFLHY